MVTLQRNPLNVKNMKPLIQLIFILFISTEMLAQHITPPSQSGDIYAQEYKSAQIYTEAYKSADDFMKQVRSGGYFGGVEFAEVYSRRFMQKQKSDTERIKLMQILPYYVKQKIWTNLYDQLPTSVQARIDKKAILQKWNTTEFQYREHIVKRGMRDEWVETGKKAIDSQIVSDKKIQELIERGEIFDAYGIDQMPEFPGGQQELLKFIQANLHMPQSVKNGKISGTVLVQFVVEVDGMVEDIEIMRSLSPECDAAAIEVVKRFPPFKPGRSAASRMRPVKVKYTVPVQFKT